MNSFLFLEGSSDEESESSIDVVEGHEVVLKTSSEKTTSDDPDYLQLLEAHQQRLEDAASGNNIFYMNVSFSWIFALLIVRLRQRVYRTAQTASLSYGSDSTLHRPAWPK